MGKLTEIDCVDWYVVNWSINNHFLITLDLQPVRIRDIPEHERFRRKLMFVNLGKTTISNLYTGAKLNGNSAERIDKRFVRYTLSIEGGGQIQIESEDAYEVNW